jgi:hypothetical protein
MAIPTPITKQANTHFDFFEVSCTDTTLFVFFFSFNLFLAIMKSKSLETRLIDSEYEFSLSSISLESNESDWYLQFLILSKTIVRA